MPSTLLLVALLSFLVVVCRCRHTMTKALRLDRAVHSVAVVTLAVGPRARSFTTTLIQSYLRNAQSDCPLYVITDDPAYFADAFQRAHARQLAQRLAFDDDDFGGAASVSAPGSQLNSFVRFIAVSADLVESDDPAERQRQKLARQADASRAGGLANNVHMRVKLLKTQLFQLLPTQFEFALYVDSDMVIGQPLRPFLERCIASMVDMRVKPLDADFPFTPNTPTVVALFPDIGKSTAPYHTGVMFMSRKRSRFLLEQWAAHIETGTYNRDQTALAVTVQEGALANFVHLLPTETASERFFAFVNGTVFRSLQPYTFVHATMYRLTQPVVFGFSHDEARNYYRRVLNAAYLYDFLDAGAKEQLEKQEAIVHKKKQTKGGGGRGAKEYM